MAFNIDTLGAFLGHTDAETWYSGTFGIVVVLVPTLRKTDDSGLNCHDFMARNCSKTY
jgi:hypothetical protein